MKILGIDTSTKFLCIGLYDGKNIYGYNLEAGRELSRLITLTLGRILDALNWKVRDIDYFACGLGPGSFTGICIGLATIKAMSWVAKKPVIGISTLDTIAANVKISDAQIIPIIDAKRNLIYCSVYKNSAGRLKRIKPYMLLGEEDFLRQFKGKAILLGDAVGLYKGRILSSTKGAVLLDKDYWYPKAHNIIALALEKVKSGKLNTAFNIKPVYLYPKECQVRQR